MPLEPFQDELPRLGRMTKLATSPADEDWYEVAVTAFSHTFHTSLNPIPVWGYDGTYPGKVFDTPRDRLVQVTWINRLTLGMPEKFPFEVIPSPYPMPGDTEHADHTTKPGHTVVHLHGAHVPADSDGWPESFLHPAGGHGHSSAIFRYPNHQPGAMLWYHDHTMHITRLNVYAGLAGPYILRDPNEADLKLPCDQYEIPLILQDRTFDSPDSPTALWHEVTADQPEFFGEYIVANGKVWPFCTVEARRYRFRVVNGANSRFFRLGVRLQTGNRSRTPSIFQIGTDGGFLPAPVEIGTTDLPRLTLAPGERADLIVDFTSCQPGDEFILTNDAPAPFPGGGDSTLDPATTGVVLKFVVKAVIGIDSSQLPAALSHNFNTNIGGEQVPLVNDDWSSNENNLNTKLAAAYPKDPRASIRYRTRTLTEEADKMVLLDTRRWEEPVTETPVVDGVEIWNIDNRTGDEHPIHVHLVQFLILDRKPLPDNTKPALPLDPNERGWKDTVRCYSGERTRIIARFTDYTGWYVWHCHMLEHEDHDMMRPMYVRCPHEPDGVQVPRPDQPGIHHH